MKTGKFLCLALAVLMLLAGCGKTKTLICDGCGAQITVKDNSDVTDEWILFCSECEEELLGDLVPTE